MSDKIYFDPINAWHFQQQIAAYLDDYVVSPPASKSSEGQMPAMFDVLAMTMMELYVQVQELIASSEKMIFEMAEDFLKADEGSAGM